MFCNVMSCYVMLCYVMLLQLHGHLRRRNVVSRSRTRILAAPRTKTRRRVGLSTHHSTSRPTPPCCRGTHSVVRTCGTLCGPQVMSSRIIEASRFCRKLTLRILRHPYLRKVKHWCVPTFLLISPSRIAMLLCYVADVSPFPPVCNRTSAGWIQ